MPPLIGSTTAVTIRGNYPTCKWPVQYSPCTRARQRYEAMQPDFIQRAFQCDPPRTPSGTPFSPRDGANAISIAMYDGRLGTLDPPDSHSKTYAAGWSTGPRVADRYAAVVYCHPERH